MTTSSTVGRAASALAVGVICASGLSACTVQNATDMAKQNLRHNVVTFTEELPEVVRLNAHETTAFREISEGGLALFHPEQTTAWPSDGLSLPQIYELEGGESGITGLTMKTIFTGSGQSGGGWTSDSKTVFLCAAIGLKAGTVTVVDVDCPDKASASFPPDREVHLADLGITE